ncbi:MAG: protein translocase subunit SecF [Sulfuricurvum sp.]|jgi:preprotein translocase subunit SecF|uniref:protein translocase subunit SecF n=1 Tax=Sulfuricurvum sp. TaxID=2025608 RepID=UPI0025EFBD85|nr:protein translocase subunit SecF [Sulfuricurvum sp.]MCK9373037.1 protein translocase subunit SecF [Sulfuricurvum sp.]
MEFFRARKAFNFMGWVKPVFAFSLVISLVAIYLIVTKGFVYGIDFAGGTVVQVKYEAPVRIDEIRKHLSTTPFASAGIQEFGSSSEIVLRLQNTTADVTKDTAAQVSDALSGTGKFEIRRVDMVGPKVGKELQTQGTIALLFSVIGILIYVAFRFEWRFAVASIIALVHDVLITAGMVSLFNVEFDLTVLAALLTILGFSINDTIVIFDRIRETIHDTKESGKYQMSVIINESVTNTLSRTILTITTVFFVVLTLFLFGGEIIHGFSFAMLIGVIFGAYSSIFVASPFLIWFGYDVAQAKAAQAEKRRQHAEKEKMRAQFEQGVV